MFNTFLNTLAILAHSACGLWRGCRR
uniref:Uncharacterized protein n=1 Tax=Anguilla anguilla TaxID=7936 RepID=A0A0E9TKY9_ANGAN